MLRSWTVLPPALVFVALLAVPASAAPAVATGRTTLEVSQSFFVPSLGDDVDVVGKVAAYAIRIRTHATTPGWILYAIDYRGVQVVDKKSGAVFTTNAVNVGAGPEDKAVTDIPLSDEPRVDPRAPGMQLFFAGSLRVSGSQRLALQLQGLFSTSE